MMGLARYAVLAVLLLQYTIQFVSAQGRPELSMEELFTSVGEDTGTVQLTVISSIPVTRDLTVQLSYSGGPSAERDIDFIGNDAFIFPQGRNQTTFSVVIVDNNIYTGPGIVRLFLVTLNGTGSAMYGVEEGRQSAAVEILDNESPPVIGFTMNSKSANVPEDSRLINLTLEASDAYLSSIAIFFNFTTVNVQDGVDYQVSNVVNLPPGMTRINYPVQILDNSVYTGPTVPRMLTVMIVPSMPSNYIINQTCKTADIEITDDEVCFFRFIDASIAPGSFNVKYEVATSSTVRCKVDNKNFRPCPNGTTFSVPQGGLHRVTFDVTCFDGMIPTGDMGPFPLNIPFTATCQNARIRDLKRRSIYTTERNVHFAWKTRGTYDRITCQIGKTPEVPCRSPYRLDQNTYNSLCSKRHTFTVRAYCGGQVVHSDQITARLFTGKACKNGCDDATFIKSPSTTVKKMSSGVQIRVSFKTKPNTFCFCKDLNDQYSRDKRCSNGSMIRLARRTGVLVISCEVQDACNTIIRSYHPF